MAGATGEKAAADPNWIATVYDEEHGPMRHHYRCYHCEVRCLYTSDEQLAKQLDDKTSLAIQADTCPRCSKHNADYRG